MTLTYWSGQRVFKTYDNCHEDVKQQLKDVGLYHKDDVVIIYPSNAYILIVGSKFEVILDDSNPVFNSLSKAEKYLWDNWIVPEGLCNSYGDIAEEISEILDGGDPKELGEVLAKYLLWAVDNKSPILQPDRNYWDNNSFIAHVVDNFNAQIEKEK